MLAAGEGTGRIAGRDGVGGDVACHDASGSDHAAVAYRHAGAYRHTAADPAVGTDRHRICIFLVLAPLDIIHGMMRCVYLYVGTYERMVAHSDVCAVEKRAVGVDEHMAPQAYAVAVVAIERRTDHRVFGDARYKVFEHTAVIMVIQAHRLQACHEGFGMPETILEFRRAHVGQQAAAHLLDFIHGKGGINVLVSGG